MRRNFASSTPATESLKLRIALPNVLPSSGNRRGPKMRRTMPKISMCSPDIPNMKRIYRLGPVVSITLLFYNFFIISISLVYADPIHPRGTNAYQMITGDDSEMDRSRWDNLYNTKTYIFGKEPASFLRENIALLPVGKALDIAMGEGRNAVYLAKKGFDVEGVDISEVALRKAKQLARENQVRITTTNADLNTYTIPAESFHVILNIDYLQRNLIPQIKRGLKHKGIVVFENHTVDQMKNKGGTQIRQFLLEQGELKKMFEDFKILVYRETNDGKDARASLVAQKP